MLALHGGNLVVRDGSVATDCGCCGPIRTCCKDGGQGPVNVSVTFSGVSVATTCQFCSEGSMMLLFDLNGTWDLAYQPEHSSTSVCSFGLTVPAGLQYQGAFIHDCSDPAQSSFWDVPIFVSLDNGVWFILVGNYNPLPAGGMNYRLFVATSEQQDDCMTPIDLTNEQSGPFVCSIASGAGVITPAFGGTVTITPS